MVQNISEVENSCKNHTPSVKLRAGASIVKKKALFSYDSRYILVPCGCDIKVFSIASGECTLTFKKHQHVVVGIQLNKNNNLQALSCSEDSTVIRWDYSDGTFLMKYDLGMTGKISTFFAPRRYEWFVTCSVEDHYRFYSLRLKSPTKIFKTVLIKPVQPYENGIALGPKVSFIAAIFDNTLHIRNMENGITKMHMVGIKKLLCIAAHPKDCVLATGDNIGCITVWTNFLDSYNPTRSLYHWHSLPLADLIFSVEGSHIYSGGNESVLVKWNLNSGTKQTLPRLGLPIHLLSVSPENTYIATSHMDNGIKIISSQNQIVQVIQGLTQGHCFDGSRQEILPTGMIYDSRSKSIVMNGRPGHLQFYNIHEDHQLFNLDIVGQNYISQERDYIIYNTDVIKAAIDDKGHWLATVEYRDDKETSPEIRLKFWLFDEIRQRFILNTNIFLPHHKTICSLKFRPQINSEVSYDPLAVTASSDGRFKIWTLSEPNTKEKKLNWVCELMGYYKDKPALDACFSEDGSILAIMFGSVATLWSPDDNSLKATLTHPENTDTIKHAVFGKSTCSQYLITHTDHQLSVWNMLTLSISWNLNCDIQFLTNDYFSDIMALFSKDNHMYIFKPCDVKPIMVLSNVSSSPVISALFVPHPWFIQADENEPCCWQDRTRLYFINENQEVMTLSDDSETVATNNVKIQQNTPITPFGMLQAETIKTDVKPAKLEKHKFYEYGKEENIEVDELPCPTNVNPISLCQKLLPSLLKVLKKDESEDYKNPIKEILSSETSSVHKKNVDVSELMDTAELTLPRLDDFKYILDYLN